MQKLILNFEKADATFGVERVYCHESDVYCRPRFGKSLTQYGTTGFRFRTNFESQLPAAEHSKTSFEINGIERNGMQFERPSRSNRVRSPAAYFSRLNMSWITKLHSSDLLLPFTRFIEAAMGFVYPSECLSCGVEIDHRMTGFCESCLEKLSPAGRNECPRCGAPVGPYVDLSKGCVQCRRQSFAFDRVIRLGIYDDEMRLACLRAKSSGGSNLSRALADTLVNQKRSSFSEYPFDLIIPVPEHWTRRFLHSHYAAEIVSRQMARRLGVPWSRSTLWKCRRTPKQATSPTAQRVKQQLGSFRVRDDSRLKGKTVLLVDDILTTGSTTDAAARALKQAGVGRVVVAVIAVSPLRS